MTHQTSERELTYAEIVRMALDYYEANRSVVTIEQAAREFSLNAIQLKEEYRKRGCEG